MCWNFISRITLQKHCHLYFNSFLFKWHQNNKKEERWINKPMELQVKKLCAIYWPLTTSGWVLRLFYVRQRWYVEHDSHDVHVFTLPLNRPWLEVKSSPLIHSVPPTLYCYFFFFLDVFRPLSSWYCLQSGTRNSINCTVRICLSHCHLCVWRKQKHLVWIRGTHREWIKAKPNLLPKKKKKKKKAARDYQHYRKANPKSLTISGLGKCVSQSMGCYDNRSWQGKSGLMSWKNNSLHQKGVCLLTEPLLETLQDDGDFKCSSDHLFPFVDKRELMNKKSHCIFRDNDHQCQRGVRGMSFPSSINLWMGGREPETPTTHYWCFLISLLVLFDPISCYSPPWLLCPLEIAKSFLLMLWFTVIACWGQARQFGDEN